MVDSYHRVARGLIKAKEANRKSCFPTTMENSFAIHALREYFKQFSSDPESVPVQIYYGQHCVKDVEISPQDAFGYRIPMHLLEPISTPVALYKPGGSPCFFEVGFRCARKLECARKISRNFRIERNFYPTYSEDEFCFLYFLLFLSCWECSGKNWGVFFKFLDQFDLNHMFLSSTASVLFLHLRSKWKWIHWLLLK